jgi:large subunit ribosomal protein L30
VTKLRVTQTRSVIHRPKDQKDTVRRLGLHRIRDSVVKEDRPDIRGMLDKVRHLVSVEEVTGDDPKGRASEGSKGSKGKGQGKGPEQGPGQGARARARAREGLT